MTAVIQRGTLGSEMQGDRTQSEHEDRTGRHFYRPRSARDCYLQKPGERQGTDSPSASEGTNPEDLLISDF